MAVATTQQLQPDWIEALGKTYAADLTRRAGIPSITTAQTQQTGESAEQFAQRQAEAQQYGIRKAGMADLIPTVAGQDALQTAAYQQATDATKGLGAYQPYLTKAGAAADDLTGLTGPLTGAQQTAYMSPYQTQVMDTALAEFDKQAAMRQQSISDAAVGIGGFGGGREGVMQAEYQSASDKNRAALQAQMLQQGFQQAQQARQQDYTNLTGIANLQANLGQTAQTGAQRQIAGLGTLGGVQQAQTQAEIDAARQGSQMAVLEPQQRLGTLGSGVIGLMGGTQGMGTTYQQTPQSSPLASALGIGSTLAGIYGMGSRN